MASCERDAWRSYRNLEDELVVAVLGCQGVENSREMLAIEFDCDTWSAPVSVMVAAMAETGFPIIDSGKVFRDDAKGRGSRTIHDGTDHRVDLSIFRSIGAGIAGCEGWGEVLLERLESAANCGRPAQARAERSLDATTSSN